MEMKIRLDVEEYTRKLDNATYLLQDLESSIGIGEIYRPIEGEPLFDCQCIVELVATIDSVRDCISEIYDEMEEYQEELKEWRENNGIDD